MEIGAIVRVVRVEPIVDPMPAPDPEPSTEPLRRPASHEPVDTQESEAARA